MHINTTARHCELDPEDRLFALGRLEKLGRFARDIQEAHLVVTAEGYFPFDARVKVGAGETEMVEGALVPDFSARLSAVERPSAVPEELLAAMLGGPVRIARALGRWRSDPPMTSMVPTGRS